MDIKDAEKIGNDNDGVIFKVTLGDDTVLWVPNDPMNMHYQGLRQWHKGKKTKPFKHTFRDATHEEVFGGDEVE